jgi:signal transduction histidine kinase
MTTITATELPTERPRRRGLYAHLGVDTLYVLLGFPLGIIAFVLVITGLSVGGGLLITLLGLPVLVGTVYGARGLAEVERARIAGVLDKPREHVRYRQRPPGSGFWRAIFTPLGEPQYWLDVAHAIIRFPVSTFAFCVVVTWWSLALGGLTFPIWGRYLPPEGPDNHDLPDLLGFSGSRTTFYVIFGVVAAITLPVVVRGCALLEAWIARALLVEVAALRNQVATLAQGQAEARSQTASAVAAEASALRRLERDIHDGPQQRLVRLSVDLGRAKEQLDADPTAARDTVDEALSQAREALAELRSLSRGIAPPILTDRGLAAAVAGLAGRSTIPVELDVLPDRLGPAVEQAAYFTVAEALTNVAKHSHATRCQVTAAREEDGLTVTISDDGVGGAHAAKGSGLAGLADRLHAIGGQLWISSPAGGPTIVRAELPC